jgi:phage repressor protein C with HTH and peptisase S24 domain
MTNSTLKDRILYAINKKGVSRRALARYCGISSAAVMAWTAGRTKELSAENALRASQFLGVSVEWLTTGQGSEDAPVIALSSDDAPPPEVVAIPEYRLLCGAGSAGEPTFEEVTESKPAYYRLDWFAAHGTTPDKCKRFVVHGDSMLPILFDGDSILVDCSADKVREGKIYAFSFAGDVRVKRLYPMFNGGMRVVSENPAVREEVIEPCDMSQFRLIGRVIDRSGSAPF